MSLIALIATSVSAYAVSSTSLASGACRRACSRNSTPVISGMRWSDAISATGRSRRANSAQHVERLGARGGADDLVVGAVLAAQVARDRLRDRRVVVDRQDRRLRHVPRLSSPDPAEASHGARTLSQRCPGVDFRPRFDQAQRGSGWPASSPVKRGMAYRTQVSTGLPLTDITQLSSRRKWGCASHHALSVSPRSWCLRAKHETFGERNTRELEDRRRERRAGGAMQRDAADEALTIEKYVRAEAFERALLAQPRVDRRDEFRRAGTGRRCVARTSSSTCVGARCRVPRTACTPGTAGRASGSEIRNPGSAARPSPSPRGPRRERGSRRRRYESARACESERMTALGIRPVR